jgi:hypothetical protein
MPRSPKLCCLLFALPTALAAQQTERYALDDESVAIYNLVGDVRLEPAGAGAGGVVVEVARAGGDAARLKVAQGEVDGRMALRVVYPGDRIRYTGHEGNTTTRLRVRDDGTFGDMGDPDVRGHHGHRSWEEGRQVTITGSGGLDARANLLIRVPRGRRVALYLAVGSVAATNVDGELALDTHEAPVTASGVKGDLSIDVGSGSVRVTQAEGLLSVDTGSGSVEVSKFRGPTLSIDTGSGDVVGTDLESEELTVDTGSGDIRLAGVTSPEVSLDTGSGSVTAELRRDISSLAIDTGSGDVNIRAPATLGAEVDIQTSNGDIESDFPLQVTRHGRDHMEGTIGDGKGRIAIETGSGGIRLLKNPN